MRNIYSKLMDFKRRYPLTIGLRLKKHAEVLEENLLPDEEVLDVYMGTEDLYNTYLVAVTDRRIIKVRKNLLYGSIVESIDKDQIISVNSYKGLLWGTLYLKTLTGTFAGLEHIDNAGINEVKASAIKNILDKKYNHKEVEKLEETEPTYVKKMKQNNLEQEEQYNIFRSKQMELCEQLDAIYRERYRIETDPVVRKEIEEKAWANYNLYMSLVGQTPEYITQPQLRLLQEKTNNS